LFDVARHFNIRGIVNLHYTLKRHRKPITSEHFGMFRNTGQVYFALAPIPLRIDTVLYADAQTSEQILREYWIFVELSG
jgi:hypothetical protein